MGTAREKHLFQFAARVIAEAARHEADYHDARAIWWMAEYAASVAVVRETAKVELKEAEITGGRRVDVIVDYGDPAAYKRMNEAFSKFHEHRAAADRFWSDATIYGTQGDRVYELDADDVHHFRLGGEARPT